MRKRVAVKEKEIKEKLIKTVLSLFAASSIGILALIVIFLFTEGLPIVWEVNPAEFLFGMHWRPTRGVYGIFPMITGSLLVTLGALLICVPLGIGCAIFIAEIAPPKLKGIVKPGIELLAGVPSVVYGFFGLIVLCSYLQRAFDKPMGTCWLAGSILLGIMALPTVASISEDAISSVPRSYKEGSLAVGATHWQTIWRVVLPSSLSGITAAVILGMCRAIGETMAVMMVTGNTPIIPEPLFDVFEPIRTLTATIALETGEVAFGGPHYHALFGIGIVLFCITFGLNLIAGWVMGRFRAKGE